MVELNTQAKEHAEKQERRDLMKRWRKEPTILVEGEDTLKLFWDYTGWKYRRKHNIEKLDNGDYRIIFL